MIFFARKSAIVLLLSSLISCSISKNFELLFHGDASLVISNSSLVLTEGGQAGTFSISLASKPVSPVSIALAASDSKEARISPQSLSFTPDDFSTPQTVTIFPLADCLPDGNKNITIDTIQVNSADSAFDSSIHPQIKSSVNVTVNDSSSSLPQLFIQANSPTLTTSEDGQVDKFLVALSCSPSQPVTVNLSSSNKSEGVIDTNSVTLDSTNYGLGALVTVTGQPDCVSEPDISYSIDATTSSFDPNFNGLSGSIGAVNKNVTLVPGLLLLNSTGQLNRGAGSYNNFQVMLTCSPVTPVTMSVALSGIVGTDYSLLSPSGASYLFDSSNWNSPADIILKILNDNTGAYSIDLTTNNASYGPMSIAVADSGMRGVNIAVTAPAGYNGQLVLANGADQTSFSGTGTFHWSYSVTSNYAFKIVSQPAGYICAIKEKQFGTPAVPASSINLNINCTAGQMVAGRFQVLEPQPLNYHLYQGKAIQLISGGGINSPTALAYFNNTLYFGDYTGAVSDVCAANNCRLLIASSTTPGAATAVISDLPAVVRGVVTDGTNLYFTMLGSSGVYKVNLSALSAAGSGNGLWTQITSGIAYPASIAFDGLNLYVADGTGNQVWKIDPSTGAKTSIVSIAAPVGIAIAGNDLYITANNAVFKAPKTGGAATPVFGTTGTPGFRDGVGTNALFKVPADIIYDGKRNLFVAEWNDDQTSVNTDGHRVRRIDLRTNRVTTIAGNGQSTALFTGTAIGANAQLPFLSGITTDGINLFVSAHKNGNNVIKITDNGLIGYWPLAGNINDYNSDGTAPVNAVATGTTSSSGRYNDTNGAYHFNGTSDYVETNKNISFTYSNAFTISAWVKIDSFTNHMVILGKSDLATSNWEYRLAVSQTGNVSFIYWNTSSINGLITNSGVGTVHAGQWTHILYEYNGIPSASNGGQLYINGKPLGKGSSYGGTLQARPANTLKIGTADMDATLGLRYFNGSIADVRIYSRSLDEGEINELAQDADPALVGNSYSNGAIGLLSHYNFEGAGSANVPVDNGPLNNSLTVSCSGAGCTVPTGIFGKDGDPGGAYSLVQDRVNGKYQYITTASDAGLPMDANPRTMCAWIKPYSYPVGGADTWRVFLGYGAQATSKGNALGLYKVSGVVKVQYMGWGDNLTVDYTPPLNTWTHICGTFDQNKQATVYINGNIINTAGFPNPLTMSNWLTTSSFVLHIGSQIGLQEFFDGAIDDVRIYNIALSSDQIRQLANQVPTGLVASYDFNGDANDVSGWGTNLGVQGTSPVLTSDRNSLSQSAYQFNGNGFFQSLTTDLPLPMGSAARTQCAWVNPVINSNWHGIMNWGQSQANGKSSTLSISGVDNSFQYSPYNTPTIGPVGMATAGKWFHVCGVYQGGATNAMIYVNGVLVASSLQPSWSTPTGFPFQIGSNNGAAIMEGTMDNVQVYNWALNQNEIASFTKSRVYVGTIVPIFGLYYTNVAGQDLNQKTTTDGLADNIINDIYADGDIVLAATPSGISRSTDGGKTFSTNLVVNGTTFYMDGNRLYIGTNAGEIYYTDDLGQTFVLLKNGFSPVTYIAASGSNIYAVTSTDFQISNDGGVSFAPPAVSLVDDQATPQPVTIRKIDINNGIVYALGTNPTPDPVVFTCSDGVTWNFLFRNGTAGLTGVSGLYVANGQIYITGSGPVGVPGLQIYKSDGSMNTPMRTYDTGSGVNDVHVLGKSVYLTSNNLLWISPDDGITFSTIPGFNSGKNIFLDW